MIGRAEVERAILEREAILEDVARLLESRTELAEWTQDMIAALALALGDSMSRTEGWKAVTLRRHLFGPAGVLPEGMAAAAVPGPSAVDRGRAERLRAGLPARVKYRAGMYLLRHAP
jgi:hypothetical protein